jgi:tetratricopeptide (TPR) repeat protein
MEIRNIKVHLDSFLITSEKDYYLLRFKDATGRNYKIIRAIAEWMFQHKGDKVRCPGEKLLEKLGLKTEEEFQDKVYLRLFYFMRHEDRVGKRGMFSLINISQGEEEEDLNFRISFAKTFLKKDGGKRSYKSSYWLGDDQSTTIEFIQDIFAPDLQIVKKYDFPETYHIYGLSKLKIARMNKNVDLYIEACEYFEIAVKHRQDFSRAYCDWGAALLDLAEILNDEDKYQDALNKFQFSLKYNKELPESHHNIALVKSKLAELDNANEALYREAIESYKQAIKYKPDYHKAFYDMGVALLRLAQKRRHDNIYQEACEKLEEAIALKVDYPLAYCNLGIALCERGELTSNEKLYFKGLDKFKLAVKYKLDYTDALYNWAMALQKYFDLKNDIQLFDKFLRLLLRALSHAVLQTDWDSAYNIAASGLLEKNVKCHDGRLYNVGETLVQAVLVIKKTAKFSSNIVDSLREIRNEIRDIDLSIDEVIDDNALQRATIFIEEQLFSGL